jgi:hypothetical protein
MNASAIASDTMPSPPKDAPQPREILVAIAIMLAAHLAIALAVCLVLKAWAID